MQEHSTEAGLQANNLTCLRGDRELFRQLNFTLLPRQVLLVEGRNGSGKSTLLRTLCGMRRGEEGDIRWCGQSIENMGVAYRSQVAYLGHQDGLKLDLTARENLSVSRALDRSAQLSVEEALDRVGLADYEDVLVRNLSAGQRRRLALARLLVTACPLWILDEPFTALDRQSREVFHRELEQHAEQGGMLVLAAHHDLAMRHVAVQRLNLSA